MTERFIPIVDIRQQPAILPARAAAPSALWQPGQALSDPLGRSLHDLRISVTDRCNFRCRYCMPREVFDSKYPYLPQGDLLSFEEITRLARYFVTLGVRKIRLTGGEPLLRKNIETLVSMLAQLRTPDGQPLDLTLTTNGSLLTRKARSLREAGLGRLTVSLDALDDAIFRQMNDADYPVADVLKGIDAAREAGFESVKINMVVKRGTNEQEILPMARHFRGSGLALRFIEYMDVGSTNDWRMDEVLPSAEVLERIRSEFGMVELPASNTGETARRWGYVDGNGMHDHALGEIGLISSVTQAFCRDCTRARISTEGQMYLCLFASRGYDLRTLLRNGTRDAQFLQTVTDIWQQREDRYSELRSHAVSGTPDRQRIEMSYIGG